MSADDKAIQVLSEQGAQCGECGNEPGDRKCPDCERCRGWYVKALREAGWAPRNEVLLEAVSIARTSADAAYTMGHDDRGRAAERIAERIQDLIEEAS